MSERFGSQKNFVVTKKERGLRRSIAKKILLRVAVLFLVAITVLFVGTYHFVKRFIVEDARLYADSLLKAMSTELWEELDFKKLSIADETAESTFNMIGDDICGNFDVDYIYAYSLDPENGSIRYYGIVCKKGFEDRINIGVFRDMEYSPNKEQLAVWNGEKDQGFFTTDNQYGHELTSISSYVDSYGARVILAVDVSYDTVFQTVRSGFFMITAVICVSFLTILAFLYLIVRKRVFIPARRISDGMTDFIREGERSRQKLDDGGGDEFAMIAQAFNRMTGEIDDYVNDIETLTKDKARQKAELDIARNIQKGFLKHPVDFGDGYEIRAMMDSAQNVGGDLYDYLHINDNETFVIIADVSGKGIAASLLMSVTLTLMRQFAQLRLSPAEILYRTNNALAESNAESLFVTAFIGIYNCSEKTFTYSNAGHNTPYILGETFRKMDGARGTLLGLFEDEQYTEETVQLKVGDILFLYTDGVDEAASADRKFYGVQRLEQTLNAFKASHGDDLVGCVSDSVKAFSAGAEQSDDITMLSLTVRERTELRLALDVSEFDKIKRTILASVMPEGIKRMLCLAVEELFVNIVSYAFPNGVPDGESVLFTLWVSDKLVVRLEDGGVPYNPLEDVTDAEDYDIERQIGGLGKLISFGIADKAEYKYEDGKNKITITKYIEEVTKNDDQQDHAGK